VLVGILTHCLSEFSLFQEADETRKGRENSARKSENIINRNGTIGIKAQVTVSK